MNDFSGDTRCTSLKRYLLLGAAALALALAMCLVPGHLQQAEAADYLWDELYFGNGSSGWGLYDNATLQDPYTDGKDVNWWVEAESPGVLYLKDFDHEVTAGSIAGITFFAETTLVVEGDNSITHLGTGGADITVLDMSSNLTIEGSGTLTLTVNSNTNGLSGIRVGANRTLTIDEATVEIYATGQSTQSTSWGIVGTGGSNLVVKNGAHLRTVGGDPANSNKGYGLYLISSNSYVTILGSGSSLISQGNTTALLLVNEPVLNGSPSYGVGARETYAGDDNDVDQAYWYPCDQWYSYCYQDDAQSQAQFVRFEEKAVLTSDSLSSAEIGTPYSQTLSATGSSPHYWSYDVRTYELPPGLVLDPWSGTISGVPTQAGSWTVVFSVSNYPFGQDSKQLTLVVTSQPTPVPPDNGGGESIELLARTADGSVLWLGVLSMVAFASAAVLSYGLARERKKQQQ